MRDALQNWRAVLLPRRFSDRAAGRALAREAQIEQFPDGVSKVTVVGRELVFYWPGPVDNNLHYVIDQEFNPLFPHYYTTPPVRLTRQSQVFDIGACEGLFAFRVLRQGLAARVTCFEPSLRNVKYTQQAAVQNAVADRLTIEPVAVGKTSGWVRFVEQATGPDGHTVQAAELGAGEGAARCVSLDDYCLAEGLSLRACDLIKIDAEGSDLDVLLGAERLIRTSAPQIAVTTYHKPEHAAEMVDFLRAVQPAYRMRLKGFSSWTSRPAPVLLQASIQE